ncbi:hypothetical protein P3TCK_04626 [Photobacterium profundum 3TCK]|uniref:Uncharacterized protein n=2 Tax=Photobacterium profundum TaxID=74109 RepID=Q1ZA60_9GAMM|nr:hypothetical protein P3TCK_04626 [Photobacterium profundum 3TCK]
MKKVCSMLAGILVSILLAGCTTNENYRPPDDLESKVRAEQRKEEANCMLNGSANCF